MSNRPTAAYGLAQMLASDPEMGTRIKAWMDANPDAMDRRKQRKLLRDLEAAEALLHAPPPPEAPPEVEPEPVECAASDVGPGFRAPKQEVPRDGDEAIDDEIACDGEADGTLGPTGTVISGQARTYGKADVLKPMHRHAWVLVCAVMAWLDAAFRFAAMVVLGAAVAMVVDVRSVWAWIGERDKSRRFLLATALRPSCIWGVVGRLVATAPIVADGVRSWRSNLFARGPPRCPCCGCDPADWVRRC